MSKQKIAVIGGGVASMTACCYLTEQPGWQEKYDITVFQQGWRLGGKGASGRNAKLGDRIEEHGLHVWFGAYVNSFATIQNVYNELNRPDNCAISTWQQAFRPHQLVVLAEDLSSGWDNWQVNFPLIPGNPANGSLDLHFWEMTRLVFYWLKQWLGDLAKHAKQANKSTHLHVKDDESDEPWWRHIIDEVKEGYEDIKDEWEAFKDELDESLDDIADDVEQALAQLGQFFAKRAHDKDLSSDSHLSALDFLITKFKRWLDEEITEFLNDNDDIRRLYICADLALAFLHGFVKDRVDKHGFAVLNQYDFKEWLTLNGANPQWSVESAPVRGFYDLVFAYKNGDFGKGDVEAGVAALAMLRISLCYRGGVMWKMQAGMGDVIFAPIYELLKQRGVNFKYFHQLENMRTNTQDGEPVVSELEFIEQVSLKNASQPYYPLYQVNNLPCWPSEPLYEQIDDEQAHLLQTHAINLEHYWDNWETIYQQHYGSPLPRKTLTLGVDFDRVIFGASVATVPVVAQELLAHDLTLAQSVAEVKTVATQAFQLWLNKDLAALGWHNAPGCHGEPILSGFSQPYDTWASMDQLINKETFPHGAVQNVAYFCSAFEMADYPPKNEHGFNEFCNQLAKNQAVTKLKHEMAPIWPNAVGINGFDWDVLYDPNQQIGEQRAQSQYYRANVDPSERYVLSVKGSSQYRLTTDGTCFSNLYITGDWIATGVNCGSVEAAVMAGMSTSRAISGWPETINGENGFLPD